MFQKIFGGIQLDSCLAKCVLVDMIVFHQSGKRLFHLINLIFENKRGFYKLYELQNPDCAKIGIIFFKTWQKGLQNNWLPNFTNTKLILSPKFAIKKICKI